PRTTPARARAARRGAPEDVSARRRMTMQTGPRSMRGSAAGKVITILLVIGLLAMGAWLILKGDGNGSGSTPPANREAGRDGPAPTGEAPSPIEPLSRQPTLDQAAPYVIKDGIVDVDISEY